ncbi:hypothetical protein SAMN05216278_3645 [Halopelagius longus]|uniref:Uncharacterized protein n=1 Tax=Halopelagius longus TaxID=1236180 RepID=A0A1H1GG14_9EURY|nr:hypothetical protein SAMN05216278_3645 [Halopelagius longus]
MVWKTASGHEARATTRPLYRPASRVGRWSSLTLRGAVAPRRLRSRGSDAIRTYLRVCQSAGTDAGRDVTFVTTLGSRLALRESDRRRTQLDETDAAATVTVAPDRACIVERTSASVAASRTRKRTSSTVPPYVGGTCVGGRRREDGQRYHLGNVGERPAGKRDAWERDPGDVRIGESERRLGGRAIAGRLRTSSETRGSRRPIRPN